MQQRTHDHDLRVSPADARVQEGVPGDDGQGEQARGGQRLAQLLAQQEQVRPFPPTAGERYCRLPEDPEYKQQYKSDVADIKNTRGREGGAITGALIIGEFVDKARWAHFDIAGTGSTSKDRHYYTKGGTGVAVRTLRTLAEYVVGL